MEDNRTAQRATVSAIKTAIVMILRKFLYHEGAWPRVVAETSSIKVAKKPSERSKILVVGRANASVNHPSAIGSVLARYHHEGTVMPRGGVSADR